MRNCILVMVAAAALAWSVSRPGEVPFRKHLIDPGASETCAAADINGDGRLDLVSGEYWYEAPAWKPHKFRSLNYSNYYIDNFSDLPLDVNGDGHVDIVSGSYFTRRMVWMQNPGRGRGEWKEHVIDTGASVEFAFLVDLDNDGKAREVLPQLAPATAPLAWYEVEAGQFVKHVVNPQSYGHGIGAGDLNGDGRNDILTPKGWFEAPADPRNGHWTWHAEPAFDKALGFVFAYDVNGDGRNDIVTSYAHDYGLVWVEQGANGQWTRHVIDESWSQPHAVTMADVNGDGQLDLITGKRFQAHNGRDPGGREPLGVYWYEFLRTNDPKRPVEWVKHVVDYGSRTGGGMQIPLADLDGDGDPDFAVAGKSGLYLFENLTKKK